MWVRGFAVTVLVLGETQFSWSELEASPLAPGMLVCVT